MTRTSAETEASRIVGAVLRDETIVRLVDGCYAGPMTWTADDRQLLSTADGRDLVDPPTKAYHSRIFAIEGDPPNPRFKDLPGYPDMPLRLRESEYASFWGGACLAVDGSVYQYLATSRYPYLLPDGSFWPDNYLAHTKLIYSPDNGLTWNNQDGSTPVVWENWDAVSEENMVFFNEQPEGAFTWLSFLQMGRNYSLNEDGYVYVYSANGGDDGTANELDLIRMPKTHILDRRSYEFFAGSGSDGQASWSSDITARSAVHTFPAGWVSNRMPGSFPMGWITSIVYNAPFDQYVMVAHGTGCGPTGGWFGKPSYLGFWVAPTPWGPFTQIHEELAWTPDNEPASRAFAPAFAPKWISSDGTSLWFAWRDYALKTMPSSDEEFNRDRDVVSELRLITDDLEFVQAWKAFHEEHELHMGFNMQRVDLIVEDH